MGIFDGMKKMGKEVNEQLDYRKVTVFWGDIASTKWDFNGGMMTPDPSTGLAECVSLYGEIEKLIVLNEQTLSDLQKTVGFDPPGGGSVFLAGLGRKEMCVMVRLKDKRKFVCRLDERIYQQMVGLAAM